MFARAKKNLDEHIFEAHSIEEAKELQEKNGGYIKTMWCGDLECELAMKEKAGMSSRCIPFAQEKLDDVCPCCGKPANKMVYWGFLRISGSPDMDAERSHTQSTEVMDFTNAEDENVPSRDMSSSAVWNSMGALNILDMYVIAGSSDLMSILLIESTLLGSISLDLSVSRMNS